jgi:CheY-like chemotaxis protein
MQIVDGLTLAHQIREHPDLKSIKIVLITGAATEAEVLQAVNHGLVDAALLKPVDVHDLQHVSRRLLNLLA